jgi:hypothetical protein
MDPVFYLLLLVSPLVTAIAGFVTTSFRRATSLLASLAVGAGFVWLAFELGRVAVFNFGPSQAAGYSAWAPPVAFAISASVSQFLSTRTVSASRRFGGALLASVLVHIAAFWAS